MGRRPFAYLRRFGWYGEPGPTQPWRVSSDRRDRPGVSLQGSASPRAARGGAGWGRAELGEQPLGPRWWRSRTWRTSRGLAGKWTQQEVPGGGGSRPGVSRGGCGVDRLGQAKWWGPNALSRNREKWLPPLPPARALRFYPPRSGLP